MYYMYWVALNRDKCGIRDLIFTDIMFSNNWPLPCLVTLLLASLFHWFKLVFLCFIICDNIWNKLSVIFWEYLTKFLEVLSCNCLVVSQFVGTNQADYLHLPVKIVSVKWNETIIAKRTKTCELSSTTYMYLLKTSFRRIHCYSLYAVYILFFTRYCFSVDLILLHFQKISPQNNFPYTSNLIRRLNSRINTSSNFVKIYLFHWITEITANFYTSIWPHSFTICFFVFLSNFATVVNDLINSKDKISTDYLVRIRLDLGNRY